MQTQDPRPTGQPPSSGSAPPTGEPKSQEEHSETIGETVNKALHGEGEPMERSAPAAPFALVGLAYLAILAIAALGIAAVVWWL